MSDFFPQVIRIEPASQCNLACSHCPTGTVSMTRGLMSSETFAAVLRSIEANQSAIDVVVFYHGGEPLLNKQLFSWVSMIRQTLPNCLIKTVTNGMILNKKNREKIIGSGLDEIEISLDGLSPKENEYIRKKANTTTITSNVSELIQLRDKSSSKLRIAISTTQFFQPDNASPKVPDWLRDLFGTSIDEYKVCSAMVWPHMDISDDYAVYQEAGNDINYCDHIQSTVTVRANGDFVPCCYDLTSQLVLGNIHQRSIQDLWQSDEMAELRSSIENKRYKSICANCNVVRPNRYLMPKWRDDLARVKND